VNPKEGGEMVPVLLVEDDLEDVHITRRAFMRGGITNPLHVVHSGEAAMEFLTNVGCYSDATQAPRPGLILLDLRLPGFDGCEVLKQIKGNPLLRRVPVVVLTTSSERADVLRCYDVGANTYITKPVEFDKFLEAVIAIGQYWLSIAEIPDCDEVVES